MEPVHELQAIEHVKRLKARYIRLIDTKRWSDVTSVFTEDCTFRLEKIAGAKIVHILDASPQEFVARVADSLRDVHTVHHAYTPEISIMSSDTAEGIWAMSDLLVHVDRNNVRALRGFGHYFETYHRDADGWKIASMELKRQYAMSSQSVGPTALIEAPTLA